MDGEIRLTQYPLKETHSTHTILVVDPRTWQIIPGSIQRCKHSIASFLGWTPDIQRHFQKEMLDTKLMFSVAILFDPNEVLWYFCTGSQQL